MTKPLIAIALLVAMTAGAAAARVAKPAAMKAGREAAMRECSMASAKYNQRTWGVREISVYRSCMAGKGYGTSLTDTLANVFH